MDDIEIRQANHKDYSRIASLFAGSEPWKTLGVDADQQLKTLTFEEYQTYIVLRNEIICGAVIVHPRGLASSPYIKSIVVDESLRGKHLGEALIHHVEGLYRSQSRHLFLCVSSFNNKAQSFYQRLGFEKVGEFRDYVIEGASEILLHKLIR